MMKLGRRKFFGLAGAAAIGGKKVAADVLTDMQSGAIPMPGYGLSQVAGSNALGGIDYTMELQGRVAKMAALRAVGVPPVFREMMRNWMGGPSQANLDDINCLVSVSNSAKKRMIRERMEQSAMDEWLDRPSRDLKRHLAEKQFGICP